MSLNKTLQIIEARLKIKLELIGAHPLGAMPGTSDRPSNFETETAQPKQVNTNNELAKKVRARVLANKQKRAGC